MMVYEITFKGNVVSSINRKEEKDLREIEVSEDSTHTTGNEITVWQQLFGNLANSTGFQTAACRRNSWLKRPWQILEQLGR
jgi:hypothetical protein